MSKEFNKDMTMKQAEEYIGKETMDKMKETGLLTAITCREINGELVIYKCDLNNALRGTQNKPTYFD